MRTKALLIFVIVLTAAAAGYWYQQRESKSELAGEKPSPETSGEAARAPVEDFIKQSAAEVVNPQAGQSRDTKSPSSEQTVAAAIAEICGGGEAGNFYCYEKYYEELVRGRGVRAAFADLRERYSQDSYVVSQCHPLTHVIGRVAVERYPTAAEAYLHGDSYCWSGYYHGALEGVIGKIGLSKLATELDTICANIPGRENYTFDYYNCVHGLGHGIMAVANTELFDSLAMCDNLTGGWEQSSCYSGVFMENVIVDNKNHFTKYLNPKDPLYPCNAVDERYKSTCYLMQTSYMLKVLNGDFVKVFDLCQQAGIHTATCFQSLGRDASGRSSSNAEATKAACSLGQSFEARANCVIGAVKDFISYFHSDVQAKALCDSLDADLRQTCTSTAESYYKSL